MITTVHLDRQGYVDTVFQNTKKETLDARKYPGTLMEVTGDVCAGWRWDGQRFVLPPPRVPPQSVRAERDRRIDGPFPERFRAQITALGGDNAMKVSSYVAAVMRVAEVFGDDAPADYKDDRHWPKVPKLIDLAVPVRVQDSVPSAPVTVNIAPVINTTQAEPKALVVHHEGVSTPPSTPGPRYDDYGLDRNDPLYDRKAKLIAFIETEVEPDAPDDESWKDALGRLAAMHTESQSLDELEKREDAVFSHIEGRAA